MHVLNQPSIYQETMLARQHYRWLDGTMYVRLVYTQEGHEGRHAVLHHLR